MMMVMNIITIAKNYITVVMVVARRKSIVMIIRSRARGHRNAIQVCHVSFHSFISVDQVRVPSHTRMREVLHFRVVQVTLTQDS